MNGLGLVLLTKVFVLLQVYQCIWGELCDFTWCKTCYRYWRAHLQVFEVWKADLHVCVLPVIFLVAAGAAAGSLVDTSPRSTVLFPSVSSWEPAFFSQSRPASRRSLSNLSFKSVYRAPDQSDREEFPFRQFRCYLWLLMALPALTLAAP